MQEIIGRVQIQPSQECLSATNYKINSQEVGKVDQYIVMTILNEYLWD